MRTKIDRWGNSLAVRLPKALAERADLREGDQADMEADDRTILMRRVRPHYTLEELVAGLTQENRHEDYFADSGDVGRERFWEGEKDVD